MKLVLLPGMDGTGQLFQNFISHCQLDCQVIQLPEYGDQTYKSLAEAIYTQLPDGDYLLLAESFSGGIVPHLIEIGSQQPKAIIFVASFLENPRPVFINFITSLPLALLLKIPSSRWLVRKMCMQGSSTETFNQFWSLLNTLDLRLIKKRLLAIKSLKKSYFQTTLPTLCITPNRDKLIPESISRSICSHGDYQSINGPHFILQTNPEESADVITRFIHFHDSNITRT